jgi:hypothetical protein
VLPDVFNAFPESIRKVGDGQPLLDALAEILPALIAAKERQVRDEVADAIEAEASRAAKLTLPAEQTFRTAARIAREDTDPHEH